MKSVKPEELFKHRVFFTEFDRITHSDLFMNSDSKLIQIIQIERKLKLYILTKAHIVIATSQLLESPIAHEIIFNNPNLLKSETIIPSLRVEYKDASDFLVWKREEAASNKNNTYHFSQTEEIAKIIDTQGKAVRWALDDMSIWFKERLVGDLRNEKSLVRSSMREKGLLYDEHLTNELSLIEGLSRGKVIDVLKKTKNNEYIDFMSYYSDFIYYLSGARTTDSEGVLPQENLIDFSLSELLGRKTKLSDNEIFFKIFLDIVKAKTSTIFPIDFLDAISISDAIELRQIALSKNFIDKYNEIQLKTKKALLISDPEKLVLLLNELDEFEESLFIEFSQALDHELPTRLKEKKQRATGNILHSIASIFLPFYSPESYKDITISGLRLLGKEKAAKKVDEKIRQGMFACEKLLENTSILEKQIFLDFVDEMKKKYSSKMFD
ncbi:MAG: hypothetical protein IPH62_15325 [Ignavibacteriae bacterium]|nr:hypothetical protein [Ignavibacteriota bacterium]